MRLISILLLLYLTPPAFGQKSRLRIEPICLVGYNFAQFNNQTIPTTSDGFYKINAFRKREDKSGHKNSSSIRNEFTRDFNVGLTLHYNLKPSLDIDLCAQTSWVGAAGGGGMYYGESGGALRVSRFSISPVYKIAYLKKHKLSIHAGLGAMVDVVSKNNLQFSGGTIAGPKDTFTYFFSNEKLNSLGFSLHPIMLLKMELENGNSFNIHFTGAIGLVPLVSSNFRYSRNQDNYYTELWSNGSFFRIGIGYEFHLFKKHFGYTETERIKGTNRYIYR